MVSAAPPPSQPYQAESPLQAPCVMLLEGYSLGPLLYLRAGLKGKCTILQPKLPMPPFFGLWFWNAKFLGMGGLFLSFSYYLYLLLQRRRSTDGLGTFGNLLSVVLYLVLSAIWIRLMAAVAVRSSLEKGCRICLRELRKYSVTAIVGFSWGGAVLAELLVQGQVGVFEEDQPAALLIAPATAAISRVAFQTDTALRVPQCSGLVQVVHATDDRAICPHPERWEDIPGIEYTLLPDTHLFSRRSSKQALARILIRMLRSQTQSQSS